YCSSNEKYYITPSTYFKIRYNDIERVTAGEIAVHLKCVDIFRNLNDHQLLDIADTCTLKVFPRGYNIVEGGKPVNYIFILLTGHARIYQTQDNGQTYVQKDTLHKSNLIGALDMLHGRNYSATVTAGVLLSCVMMSNESFNDLVRPILEDLRAKAEQYENFLNAFV
ncbi:unnamed protein product, partial [Rotaria magnacalcarata]